MSEAISVKIIAHIYNDYKSKFGIPRQSGIVNSLESKIIFEPEFRNPDYLRGISGYSHLWLIWNFSKSAKSISAPTVRPPKLGGNTRMGVFATRSPFRPNPLGLSSVELIKTDNTADGPVLYVSGADLADGTPILDIKPYLPYTDSHPNAESGFALKPEYTTNVVIPPELCAKLPQQLKNGLFEILKHDPRPGYQHDPHRVYKLQLGSYDIGFCIKDNTAEVLSVDEI